MADLLDRASEPPMLIPEGSLFDTQGTITRSDIAPAGSTFRELSERLRRLPPSNLLGSLEFFEIANEALVQIERLERSHLWQHIPNNLKIAMQTYKSFYNPRICEVIEMVFSGILNAIPHSLVLNVRRETLEYVASRLDISE